MEFTVQILGSIEDHCFACLGTEDLAESLIENREIPYVFEETFNFEVRTWTRLHGLFFS